MLDEKDLQAIQSLIERSEARMTAKIEEKISDSEARMTAKIEDSEARMTAKIKDSEARMATQIEDTRSMIMAYLESAIEPQIRVVAEGYRTLQETKADNSRVDKLEEDAATSRSLIMLLGDDVAELKKAQ